MGVRTKIFIVTSQGLHNVCIPKNGVLVADSNFPSMRSKNSFPQELISHRVSQLRKMKKYMCTNESLVILIVILKKLMMKI
jgi:hypothetical protein